MNLIQNSDWKGNFYLPDPSRDNIRIPNMWWFEFKEGDSSVYDMPGQDRATALLAPETVFRSGDTIRFPFTERLPDHELNLYLNNESPIVYHVFKRYGKQWWELGQTVKELPSGVYRLSFELYPDVYSNDHQWAPDPLSWECRLNVSDGLIVKTTEWQDGSVHRFGSWNTSGYIFNWDGGDCSVSAEIRARWGVEVVGTFARNPKLESVLVTPPPQDDLRELMRRNVDELIALASRMREELE